MDAGARTYAPRKGVRGIVNALRTDQGFGIFLGFVLAAVLPAVSLNILLWLGPLFSAGPVSFDFAGCMTVMTIGIPVALPPLLVAGIPLCVVRRRLGRWALPLVSLVAAVAGGVTTVVFFGADRDLLGNLVTGALLAQPSALAFWWFALRPLPAGPVR